MVTSLDPPDIFENINPNQVVSIKTISDFPTPVGDVITAELNTVYSIDAPIVMSDRFKLLNTSIPRFISTNKTVNTLTYTGSDTFFISEPGSTSGKVEFENINIIGNPNGTLFDLNGHQFDGFKADLLSWKNIGIIRNAGLFAGCRFRFGRITFNGSGLKMINNGVFVLEQSATFNLVDSNLPLFTIIGPIKAVFITTCLMNRQTNESAIYLDPNLNNDPLVNIKTIEGSVGAGFYTPGTTASITAFADSATSPGVKTTVTSVGHGLIDNQAVAIIGTTSYNGTSLISDVTTDTYDIEKVFVADDATGTWDSNGINQKDIRVQSIDVDGNPDSKTLADTFLTVTQTVTIATANVPVVVGGVNWQFPDVNEEFIVNSAGLITYIGLKTKTFIIDGRITVGKTSGGSDFIDAGFTINGVDDITHFAGTQNNSPTQVSPLSITTLDTGDTVQLSVRNVDNANDINVENNAVVAIHAT